MYKKAVLQGYIDTRRAEENKQKGLPAMKWLSPEDLLSEGLSSSVAKVFKFVDNASKSSQTSVKKFFKPVEIWLHWHYHQNLWRLDPQSCLSWCCADIVLHMLQRWWPYTNYSLMKIFKQLSPCIQEITCSHQLKQFSDARKAPYQIKFCLYEKSSLYLDQRYTNLKPY